MTNHDRDVFEQACEELSKELPERLARALSRLRAPHMKWTRLTTGALFLVGGALSFLPVLGLELVPLGLLFLAQDVAFLRRPTAMLLLWLVAQWRRFKGRVGRAAGASAAHAV